MDRFKIRYLKSNNTLSIRKFSNGNWLFWYEIDMDDASLSRLSEWKKHLFEKIWMTQDLWDRVSETYQFNMYNLK